MIYQLADGVQVVALENEGFVTNTTNRTYFRLTNDTAAGLMGMLGLAKSHNLGVSEANMKEYLLMYFQVGGPRVDADLSGPQGFLAKLTSHGLIRPATAEEPLVFSNPVGVRATYRKPDLQVTSQNNPHDPRVDKMGFIKVWPKIAR
ncbi:MAG: hypothetical protein K6T55_09505 [Syntrophobacterales bacterium]|nr:hypothetical protein [Syntrophobacterales bacterium]